MRAARIWRAARWLRLVSGRRAARAVANREAPAARAREEKESGDLASAARLPETIGAVHLGYATAADVACAIGVQRQPPPPGAEQLGGVCAWLAPAGPIRRGVLLCATKGSCRRPCSSLVPGAATRSGSRGAHQRVCRADGAERGFGRKSRDRPSYSDEISKHGKFCAGIHPKGVLFHLLTYGRQISTSRGGRPRPLCAVTLPSDMIILPCIRLRRTAARIVS